MIEVKGLSKRYGTHLAVNDVNFSIKKGEVIGFLGPNGAGKSTIMNILTGYLSLTQGQVSIDGFDIMENPEEAKKRIGYLPEIPPLYIDMKVKEYLYFIYDLKKVKFPKKAHIDEIMKLIKIDNVQNRLIKNLSKGYRQRVGLAQALVGNPDVLILDEPTVGLDPKQIIEIRNLISRLGKNHTIILSSHILSEIQAVCERVIIINQGRIIADDNANDLSNRLSNDCSIVARIDGSEKDTLAALKNVKGVKNVMSLGCKEQGSFDFIVEPQGDVDIRKAIFECAVSKGRTILSLTSNKLSLEQVFLRLTEAGSYEEARKLLGFEDEETTDETTEEIVEETIEAVSAEVKEEE